MSIHQEYSLCDAVLVSFDKAAKFTAWDPEY